MLLWTVLTGAFPWNPARRISSPNDVFANNSYYDANDYEDVPVTSEQDIFRKYLEIAKLEKEKIEAAKKLLLTDYSDEAKKFNLRFKRSMNNKKTPGGFNPYSF